MGHFGEMGNKKQGQPVTQNISGDFKTKDLFYMTFFGLII
jgi:hypothetical protein